MGIHFDVRRWSKSTKILVSWTGIIIVGISSFFLTKRGVDQKRYEIMKSKERMRNANLALEGSDK